MPVSLEDVLALESLDAKFRAILPATYSDSYDDVLPMSMGSADLKYGSDGKVAWNEMWATFCDLAMAGGPPHRGSLLQPASPEEIGAAPEQYDRATQEICRGIAMVTGLSVQSSSEPGWIGVQCRSVGMAAWLVRAIVMENVLARHDQEMLYLPAGPGFRLAKEIKNVVTVIAKTSHYWLAHMPEDQQQSMDAMFAETDLLEPATPSEVRREPEAYGKVADEITESIDQRMGLTCFPHRYLGWMGIECPNVRIAIWVMRVMMVENILARREDELVFLPVSPRFATGDRSQRLIRTFTHAYRLSGIK